MKKKKAINTANKITLISLYNLGDRGCRFTIEAGYITKVTGRKEAIKKG